MDVAWFHFFKLRAHLKVQLLVTKYFEVELRVTESIKLALAGMGKKNMSTTKLVAKSSKLCSSELKEHISLVKESGLLIVPSEHPTNASTPVLKRIKSDTDELLTALHGLHNPTEMFNSYNKEGFASDLTKRESSLWDSVTSRIKSAVLETARNCGYFETVHEVYPMNNLILRLKSIKGHETPIHCDLRHYIDENVLLDPVQTIFDISGACKLLKPKERIAVPFHPAEDVCLYNPYWTAILLLEDLYRGSSEIQVVLGSNSFPLIWDDRELKARSINLKKGLIPIRILDEIDDSGLLMKMGTLIFISQTLLHYGTPHLLQLRAKEANARNGKLDCARKTCDVRFAANLRYSYPETPENFAVEIARDSAVQLEQMFSIMCGDKSLSMCFEDSTINRVGIGGCGIIFLLDIVHSLLAPSNCQFGSVRHQLRKALENTGDIIMNSLQATWNNWEDPDTDQAIENIMVDHLHILNFRLHSVRISSKERKFRLRHLGKMSKERLPSCDFNQSEIGIINFRDPAKRMKIPMPGDKYHTELEAWYRYWIFSQLAYDIGVEIETSSTLGLGEMEIETNLMAVCRYRRNGYELLLIQFSEVIELQCKIVELVTHLIYAFSGWGLCRLPAKEFSEEILLMQKASLTSCRFNVDALCEMYFAFVLLGLDNDAAKIRSRVFMLSKAYPDSFIPSLESVKKSKYRNLTDQETIYGIRWHSLWAQTLLVIETPKNHVLEIEQGAEDGQLAKYAVMMQIWRRVKDTSKQLKNTVEAEYPERSKKSVEAEYPERSKKSVASSRRKRIPPTEIKSQTKTVKIASDPVPTEIKSGVRISEQLKLLQSTVERCLDGQSIIADRITALEQNLSGYAEQLSRISCGNGEITSIVSPQQSGKNVGSIVTISKSSLNSPVIYDDKEGALVVVNALKVIMDSWLLRSIMPNCPFDDDEVVLRLFKNYVEDVLVVGKLSEVAQEPVSGKDRAILAEVSRLWRSENGIKGEEVSNVDNAQQEIVLKVLKSKLVRQRTQTRSSFLTRAKSVLLRDSRIQYAALSEPMKCIALENIRQGQNLQDRTLCADMAKAACKVSHNDLANNPGILSLMFVGLMLQTKKVGGRKRTRTNFSNKLRWEALMKGCSLTEGSASNSPIKKQPSNSSNTIHVIDEETDTPKRLNMAIRRSRKEFPQDQEVGYPLKKRRSFLERMESGDSSSSDAE